MAHYHIYFVKLKNKKSKRADINDFMDSLVANRTFGEQPYYKAPFLWVEVISVGFIVASNIANSATFTNAGVGLLSANVQFDEVRKLSSKDVFDFELSNDWEQINIHIKEMQDDGNTTNGFA
ncbi:hypothetical protein [Pseudomonas sp. NFACC46-3]|uniref:hypothetical protein n=1 Tax=Pseudomonas sp. NFACC46-3 TaxID=1566200 RepID=UPI0008F3F153|nr:hypothetical protein [Pseudomonas sp. NFACC46-3]SFL16864.1 hypothetical protein SAMN03159307_01025 [Pseudomonas sp. NFACC46-3]